MCINGVFPGDQSIKSFYSILRLCSTSEYNKLQIEQRRYTLKKSLVETKSVGFLNECKMIPVILALVHSMDDTHCRPVFQEEIK